MPIKRHKAVRVPRLVAALGILGASALLVACAVAINAPPNNAIRYTPTAAVEVSLPLPYVAGSFRAWVSDREVTSAFTVDAATRRATAALPVTPGPVRLVVLACWWIPYNGPPPTIPIQTSGCPTASADFSVRPAALQLLPVPVPFSFGDSAPLGVSAVPPPATALTVRLSGGGAVVGAPATVTIPAGASAPTGFALEATAAGSATLRAQATGWADATAAVGVSPRLDALVPADGLAGTALTLVGGGFTSPSQVLVGASTINGVVPSAGGTRLALTVPANALPGPLAVSVRAAGFTSPPLTFTVLPTITLFRGTHDSIETISFTQALPFSASTLALLGKVGATPSPGNLSVGLARTGAFLARTGSSNLQLFAVGGTAAAPTVTLSGATGPSGGLSGTGSAAAISLGALLRGSNAGIEMIGTSGTPLPKLASLSTAASTHGTALAVDTTSRRAWRSVDSGLETYDIRAPTAPLLLDFKNSDILRSSTGTALAWLSPGMLIVRATDVGIDLLDTSASAPARVGTANTGGASSLGVAVAAIGARVVRATSQGLEVWDVTVPGTPRLCSRSNQGDLSATGVGLVVTGTVALRATNRSVEAYDISDITCPSTPSNTLIPPPLILRNGLGLSATGVALVR